MPCPYGTPINVKDIQFHQSCLWQLETDDCGGIEGVGVNRKLELCRKRCHSQLSYCANGAAIDDCNSIQIHARKAQIGIRSGSIHDFQIAS